MILGVFSLLACSGATSPDESAAPSGTREVPLSVYVVNYPLQFFAERIGGERVQVVFPAPRDVDPAFWVPEPEVVLAYQQADVILLNGAGYARWVDRVTLSPEKLVDTSDSFKSRYVTVPGAVVHSHGPEGEHSHGEVAFTTWLDMKLAMEHAGAVLKALGTLRPEHSAEFQRRFETLRSQLEKLDQQWTALTSEKFEVSLLGSHPVYQYLARGYQLKLRSVHFEPGELPGEKQWRELAGLLEDHPAEWMLWEAQPLAATVARLEKLGGKSVVFNPCANSPAQGDLLSVMRRNLEGLESVYGSEE